MQNGLLGASQGVNSPTDKILTARGEDLEPDIVGSDTRLFDQASRKVEVCLRGRRERHFDLFVANIHEHFEEAIFLLPIHWVGEGLVTVTQVGSQPSWCLFDNTVGPLAVW